jgi:hypothetical protein
MIGPYPAREILLLSADASPNSQREEPGEAGFFFPGGHWVGAVRNTAERTGCDFRIVATEHGFVSSDEVITPYDFHIDIDPARARAIWAESFARKVPRDRYKLAIFYAGGCPRKSYLEIIVPLCHAAGIGVLTFGQPNMYDIGKLDQVVDLVVAGTMLEELRAIMGVPGRVEHYSVGKPIST